MRFTDVKNWDRSVYDWVKMLDDGKINLDNSAQRPFVWKNTPKDNRESWLIRSVLLGIPIPEMLGNRAFDEDHPKKYEIQLIDGKQRITTLSNFIHDGFPIVNVDPIPLDEDVDATSEERNDDDEFVVVNGKKFSELPEEFQRRIQSTMIRMEYFENLSQDDIDEVFAARNNGKPLTAIDLTRVKAKSLPAIKQLAKHPLFDFILSEKSIKGRINEDIVMKTWVELYTDEPSFLTKDFRPTIEDAVFTEEQISEMELIFRRIYEVYNALKAQGTPTSDKILRHIKPKTHIISIAYAAQKSINDGVPIDKFIDWVSEFYGNEKNGASVSKTYNDNAKAGSAEPNAINKRLTAMMANYEKFFANDSEVDKNEYHQIGGTDSDDSEQRQDVDGQDLNEEQEQLPQEPSEQDDDAKYNEENEIA